MTLGEIKIEALKLMFVNIDDDIYPEKLAEMENDETYRGYLYNMPGAINRCFSNLEAKRILPSVRLVLVTSGDGAYVRYDLSQIDNFFDIERVIRETGAGEYDGDFGYTREGNVLVFENDADAKYTLIYKPKLPRIKSYDSEEMELPIPDDIASYIPYFIKGDLYRDDEPGEAAEARNWYEQAMEELMRMQHSVANITRVKEIYSQEHL